MITGTTLHQRLVNEACESLGKKKRAEWLDELSKKHRAAIVFKDLNYQVENGGFSQWEENKYKGDLPWLYSYLNEIGTDCALYLINLLKDFESRSKDNEQIRDLMLQGKAHPDDEDYYEDLDSNYYKTNEQLLADIDYWLASLG